MSKNRINRIEAARYLATNRAQHDSENVQIDSDAEVTPSPMGMWVQAWILIAQEDITDVMQEFNI
jgi:hypothetical protein